MAHVNALDEVPQSYSYPRNPKLDQTRHATKTRAHEFVDLKMIRLLLQVCAFNEEERHVIMDCLFLPFHIRICIVRQWSYKMW